jgi:hypothetical protein
MGDREVISDSIREVFKTYERGWDVKLNRLAKVGEMEEKRALN